MPKSQPEMMSGEGGKMSDDADLFDVAVLDSAEYICFPAVGAEEPEATSLYENLLRLAVFSMLLFSSSMACFF